jgi:hypothetical protein
MPDSHKNFAYSTVATAPSPASSGTSLVVAAGDGTKFPAVPFNVTIWPAATQPTTTNAEVARCTAISTDTLTITRAQESSSARTVVVGDQIAATVTAKTLTDAENSLATDTLWATKGDLAVATANDTAAVLPVGTHLFDRIVADTAATTGQKWVPHIVRRSANAAARNNGNTGNTLTDDDATGGTLQWTMAANEVWYFQAWLLVSAANTTMLSKFGFSFPTSATATWGSGGASNVAQPGYGAWTSTTPIAMLTQTGALTVGTFNGTIGVNLAGVFVNSSNAGNVTLQWAQSVSNVGNLILLANSILMLWRLA